MGCLVMKGLHRYQSFIILVGALSLGGCTKISVAPSCPNELQVDESGPLLANEENPGAIAKYSWEVTPPEVGQVTEPTKPTTTFKATGEGEAVIRLTASDGLYQVVSECKTRVAAKTEAPPQDSADASDNTNDSASDDKDEGTTNTDTGRPPRGSRGDRTEPTPP